MKLFYFDLGHNPRSATTLSTGDAAKFQTAQNAWFAYYVKGEGGEPAEAHGGVTAITSFCPQIGGRLGAPNTKPPTGRASRRRNPPRKRRRTDDPGPGHGARRRLHLGHDLHHAGRRRQRLGGDVQAGPAPGGRLHDRRLLDGDRVNSRRRGPNDQVIARLYDVNETAKAAPSS